MYYFNPRLREGGDVELGKPYIKLTISIHASAKEATWNGQTMLNSDVDFNPRLREGGDGFYWSKHCKRCLISIHASAKEATFEHLLYVLDEHIFQSTPPRRRRLETPRHLASAACISIHASAKEATATYCDTSAIMYISSLNNFFVHFF